MKALETHLKELLSGYVQYRIPYFQRPYSWRQKQWEALWQDLLDLYESDRPQDHFLGAIVTVSLQGNPAGVTPHLLIKVDPEIRTGS